MILRGKYRLKIQVDCYTFSEPADGIWYEFIQNYAKKQKDFGKKSVWGMNDGWCSRVLPEKISHHNNQPNESRNGNHYGMEC